MQHDELLPPLRTVVPAPELYQALEQFNQGLFFQSHETLENAWRVTGYPLRLFYQGVIKVAVGFLHLTRGNRHGAVKLLRDAMDLLEPFEPEFMGVQVRTLRRDATYWLRWTDLQSRIPRVAPHDLPKAHFHAP